MTTARQTAPPSVAHVPTTLGALVQRKAILGTPGDRFEQEADRIADLATAPAPSPLTTSLPITPLIQREPDEEPDEEEEETLQTKQRDTRADLPTDADIDRASDALLSSGSPLSTADRAFFEPRFGRDLSHVRLHTGPEVARATSKIGARAYTLGQNIGFADGQYAPHTATGRHLLAHELTHTIQQGRSPLRVQREVAPPVDHASSVTPASMADADLEVEQIDAAFVFTGGAYGRAARSYIQLYHPDHHLIEARSFEALFDRLFALMTASRGSGMNPHLRELIIVTHANAAGGLQIPLTRGAGPQRTFNIWSLSEVQQEFRDGLHQRMQARRSAVVADLIDTDTQVIVRGCEFGQAPEALDALRSFFGGDAYVWAPTGFQGFENLRIGGSRLPTPEAAFDFLMQQDYLPPELDPLPDEDKREYIARVFGLHGQVPAMFFVMGRDDYTALQTMIQARTGTSADAEEFKERDAVITSDDDLWNVSHASHLGRPDAELDALSLEQLEARGRALMAEYRPEIAYMIVRLGLAWERKGMEVMERYRDSNDPLAGMPPEDAFGGMEVRQDARRFPGPTRDAFEIETITPPADETPAEDEAFTEGLAAGSENIPPEPETGGGSTNAERPRPARPGQADQSAQDTSRPRGRAAAQDFSKSTGLPVPQDPEPEGPVDIQAILDALPADSDREMAQRILDQMPETGWQLSNYLSAAELSISAASAPLTFVEGVGALVLIEGGAIVVGGALSIIGYLAAVSESAETWERESRALGVNIGYERVLLEAFRDTIPDEFSAASLREGLTSDRRVVSQIQYNIPHGGRHVVRDVSAGVDTVVQDANRTIQAADQALRQRLSQAGLRGDDLARAHAAAKHVIRQRFLQEMVRAGRAAAETRREAIRQQEAEQ